MTRESRPVRRPPQISGPDRSTTSTIVVGRLLTRTGELTATVSINVEGRIRECGQLLELDPHLAKEGAILHRVATRLHADRERRAA
jgi:hypothetical protein